ncbi:MAG: hypothetical protein ACXVHK_32310, partial [Solirubrobacteraceae bacterium]
RISDFAADGPALFDRALAAGKGHETVQELADDEKFFEWAARTYPRARFTGPSNYRDAWQRFPLWGAAGRV